MDAQTRADLAHIAATEEGRSVLRWLKSYVGYDDCDIAKDANGEIAPLATIHNIVLRKLWVELRVMIPVQDRIKIENPEYEELYQPCHKTEQQEQTQEQTPEQMQEVPLHRQRLQQAQEARRQSS